MRVPFFPLCFLALFAPLAFAQTPAAPATVSSTLDGAALQRGLDTAFAQARAAGFSGTLLVADHGKRVYEAHAGLADREQDVAIDEHTRFNTASNGKLFTIVAALQLVAQKKLDLDASVGTYLPDWPQPIVRDQVTVRQLLSHTSGLGSYFGSPAFQTMRANLVDISAHLPLIQAETPAFAPGTDWAYSNSGFMLLGRLIEVVSGEDYYTYVQRHVFDPAGMRDSGYFDTAGKAEHVALGYIPTANGLQDNRNTREWRGGPAGGGYTSARDLLRFHEALVGGTLLPPDALALFFAPVALPGEGARRGHALGPILRRIGDDMLYGHPGGSAGVSVDFWALRERGLVVVVLGNVAPTPGVPQPNPAMPLLQESYAAIAAAGGPKLGGGMRRR